MNNRIRSVRWIDHSIIPAAADIRLEVVPEFVTPTTEVRGRLMGPSCLYSTTIELAYPFRPISSSSASPSTVTVRATIVEASLWDPTSPFLYRAAHRTLAGWGPERAPSARSRSQTMQRKPAWLGLEWEAAKAKWLTMRFFR